MSDDKTPIEPQKIITGEYNPQITWEITGLINEETQTPYNKNILKKIPPSLVTYQEEEPIFYLDLTPKTTQILLTGLQKVKEAYTGKKTQTPIHKKLLTWAKKHKIMATLATSFTLYILFSAIIGSITLINVAQP